MPAMDELPWWEWPDFARVALVLAVVAAIGLLVRAISGWASRARESGAARSKPGQGNTNRRNTNRGNTNRRNTRMAGAGTHIAQVQAPAEGQAVTGAPAHHEEFPTRAPDPVLRFLHRIMRLATYVLAIAMVVVILEGVISVLHTLYVSMSRPPYFMVPDIVQTFGAFLAVLIAYEIFANITLYLRTDVFPVKLVVATAVMAIARKIIILDTEQYTALDLMGIGVMVLALGIAYWLISQADAGARHMHPQSRHEDEDQ